MTCAEGAPPPLRARGKAGRRAQIELDLRIAVVATRSNLVFIL